jgi:dihydrofolate synthase/folylpolyglutamate synthase
LSRSAGSEFETYRSAAASLDALIRGERFASRSVASRRHRAEVKLERIRAMLREVGDPHHRYPVVHITGTSGKGSTAATVAAILTAAGYRVGLRTSPYLQVAPEKLQIWPSLIDASSFAEMTARVLATAARLFRFEPAELSFSYAEAWSVLGYWWFAEREVDVAIVEVGSGGRFDATNVIDPIVSVITSVGLDHLVTLGPSIADIAWHKAGIIKRGATAVVGELPAEALSVIAEKAKSASVDLIRAPRIDGSRKHVLLATSEFQARNAEVATTVARVLVQRGFGISDAAVTNGIRVARLPGRLERMPGTVDPAVWIDGAHNEDKVTALAREAASRFGASALPVIVVGMLRSKDASGVLAKLGSVASSIITTEPSVIGKGSVAAGALADVATASGFAGAVHVEQNPDAAMRCAEAIASREGAAVLVAGSMYLAGQVRSRWYPDQQVVLQRTPWPSATEATRLSALRPFGGLIRDKSDRERDETADQQESARVDEEIVR